MSIHKALNVPDVIARSKRLLSKEARQLRVGLALVKSLPKFSVCGSVGFIRGGSSTADQNILIWFPIVETLFPVCGITCGSGPPGTLYAATPKMVTERIHSDQPPAVRVYLGGRSTRTPRPVGTVPQRHREVSLKVEASP